MRTLCPYLALVGWLLLGLMSPAAAVPISVVNGDDLGEGFNDQSPFSSQGGNTAPTLGAARLQALEFAVGLIAGALEGSQTVTVVAQFEPLPGDDTSAVLGSGGTTALYRDFAGAPRAATYYPAALANELAGMDLDRGTAAEIRIFFNSRVDDGNVVGGKTFYLGLDAKAPAGTIDFIQVATHELIHGLGFASTLNPATGAKLNGFDDAHSLNLERLGATPSDFPSMTDAQRRAASTAGPDVYWAGPEGRAASGRLTSGRGPDGRIEIYAPGPTASSQSLSHLATAVAPAEIMEFAYEAGAATNYCLSRALLRDLGWKTTECQEPQAAASTSDAIVLVDDALPPGATQLGNEAWTWVTNPAPIAGALAHGVGAAAGENQHYYVAPGVAHVPVVAGDVLVVYAHLDAAAPPRQLMVQWYDGSSFDHRAYWGENLIGFGTDGTASRRSMGALPTTGSWVRLEIPAAQVGMEGRTIAGLAFTHVDGQVTWDFAGVLRDLDLPAPKVGRLAHLSPAASGVHQHYFDFAASSLPILAGDKLYAWVYVDPEAPPQELVLQWNDGSWEHRAYWGQDLIALGIEGSPSRFGMGPLPAPGEWVRLEVSAAAVGLEGRSLRGLAFTAHGGRVMWDAAGRAPAGGGDAAWIDDETPAGATLFASGEGWLWVGASPP